MPDTAPTTPTSSAPDKGVNGAPPATAKDGKPDAPAPAAEPKPAKAKDYAAIARRGFQLRQERKAMAEERAQWAKAQGETSSRLAELERRAKASDDELAAAKADPIGWAAKHGVKPDDSIRGFLKSDTPEAGVEAAKAEAKAAREELAAFRKEQADKEAKREADSVARWEEQSVRNFVQIVTGDPKKYPHMNLEHEPQEIQRLVTQIQQTAKSKGHTYTFEEVANFLEGQAKKRTELKAERRKALFGELSPDGSGGPSSPGTPASGHRESKERPASSARANGAAAKPKKKTRQEEEEEDLMALRKATAQDAVARKSGKA